MIVGNLSLGQMVARLTEAVGGLGLTNEAVGHYEAAFDDMVAFADRAGGQGWSNSMADRHLERLEGLAASGSVTDEVGRGRRRAFRMPVPLVATGEVGLSHVSGTPARHPVDSQANELADATVEGSGASGVTAKQPRPPVGHLLWHAAGRGISPLEVGDAPIMEFPVEGVPGANGGGRGRVLRCVRLAAGWLKGHGGRVRRGYSSPKLKEGRRVVVPALTEAGIRDVVASIDTGSATGERDLAISCSPIARASAGSTYGA